MKMILKKYILIIFAMLLAIPSFGQRNVRKLEKQGNKAYKAHKYNQAITSYEKALKINSASKVGNYNLSNAYYKQGQWDKAIMQTNKYLKLETEDPKKMAAAWHNLGNSLLQKKDLEQAIDAYKNSLYLNPEDEETRYNLAVAKKLKQDKDKDKNSGAGQQNQQKQDNKENKDKNKDTKQQNQDKNQQNQDQKLQENQPQQMSSENAKQILQAIQQDEKATQQRVQQMKAKEREEKSQDNRRNNKDW